MARDPVGVKPLYYFWDMDKFIFFFGNKSYFGTWFAKAVRYGRF